MGRRNVLKFIVKFLVVWAIRMAVVAVLMSIFFVFEDNNNIENAIRVILSGFLYLASGVGAYFTLLYSNKPITDEERAKGIFWAALTPAFLAAAQYISQYVD